MASRCRFAAAIAAALSSSLEAVDMSDAASCASRSFRAAMPICFFRSARGVSEKSQKASEDANVKGVSG